MRTLKFAKAISGKWISIKRWTFSQFKIKKMFHLYYFHAGAWKLFGNLWKKVVSIPIISGKRFKILLSRPSSGNILYFRFTQSVSDRYEVILHYLLSSLSCEPSMYTLVKANVKKEWSCHELFGFDIMLDDKLKPWLLEVNISPRYQH